LDEVLTASAPGLWFEVHSENYMVDGGPRLAALRAVRERHPVSLHGVGLSLASPDPPDADYLLRLRRLAELIDPAAISDHLAWQKWGGVHTMDFLPFPRTCEALCVLSNNINRVQCFLGRRILIENPSLYADVCGHDYEEAEFLSEIVERTGCGLLIDINNVFVSASNLGFSAAAYIDALPAAAIGEVHLAGHAADPDPQSPLLIDSHDAPIGEAVWRLFVRLTARVGARATLIERDGKIPPFQELFTERDRAHHVLTRCAPIGEPRYA
jgi:uncharacterized protein (UPF0276 family)